MIFYISEKAVLILTGASGVEFANLNSTFYLFYLFELLLFLLVKTYFVKAFFISRNLFCQSFFKHTKLSKLRFIGTVCGL